MRVFGLTRVMSAAAVAAVVAMCAGDAMAFGHRGGSSGSSGSYGSYGSSGSSGSYASSGSSGSGSSGSHGGLFARWHARKAARAASSGSSSYGSYGSSGSSGSYGSYGSSGSSGSASSGSAGSYGSSGVYYDSAPVEMEVAPEVAPTAEPPAPPQASINVTVPADAVVFVNDRPTTSTGANRNYISRGLSYGRTYAYQIRVEFERNGEKVVENKVVRLQAGQSEQLNFGDGEQMAKETEPAKTQVTLHVPAGAQVTLAGASTHQTGEERTYVTTNLADGQKWDGYVVRVTLDRDGKTLTEEKTLSIVGGQDYELSFDFADEAAKVASLN